MATALEHGVRLSQTSPEFLHANSTSHTWVYSAIAELIDNSYDASAKQLYIDKKVCYSNDCLVFRDDGEGMDGDKLHHMLSFGYCDKLQNSSNKPVGRYGNGFKSGSMRLGRDAIVFTKNGKTMSVGFLSQTYLRAISAKTVLVPVVTWDQNTSCILHAPHTDGSLRAITTFSPYKKIDHLLEEFKTMSDSPTGTLIIIYTLKRGHDDKLELDFDSVPTDIINSEREVIDEMVIRSSRTFHQHVSLYKKSLREYCSILFLRPRMKIILRGEKVKTKLIAKSLSQTEKDVYRPMWLRGQESVKMTFGFTSGKDYGLMMYHKNRLIKAYERIGYQKQGSGEGNGIVGVVRVDFLEPTHNKQDFNMTNEYNTFMNAIGMKLNDYWNTKMGTPGVPATAKPDWTWVQCDSCLKWRRLPDHGLSEDDLPDKWFCYMNQDPIHNRCDIEEEPEDEDELLQRATYTKAKPKEAEKRNRTMTLVKKEVELQQKEQELHHLERKIKQQPEHLAPVIREAKASLIQAAQREREQLDYIRVLKSREKALLKQQEDLKRMAEKRAALPRSMTKSDAPVNLDSDDEDDRWPRPGTSSGNSPAGSKRRPQVPPNPPLKVKLSMPLPSKRRASEKVVETGNDYVITQNEDKSDDDDVVIIEVEPKKRKVADPVDVKPDVEKLNSEMNNAKTTTVPPTATAPSPIVVAPTPSLGTSARTGMPQSGVNTADAGKDSTNSSGNKDKETGSAIHPDDDKPDVDMLDEQITVTKSEATSSQELAKKDASKSTTAATDSGASTEVQVASASSSSDTAKPPSTTAASKNFSSTSVQTDNSSENEGQPSCSCKQEVTEMKQTLSTLRSNVYKLLNVFVPELSLDDMDMIDTVVVEMIRVNSTGKNDKTEEISSAVMSNGMTEIQDQ